MGYHLLRVAKYKYELFGITHSSKVELEGASLHNCDITNYVQLGNLIEDIEPDAVIHAAALSNTAVCEKDPELSFRVNVEASVNLAGMCNDLSIPFLFTSTDLVFDGKQGNYNEEDNVSPLSVYGKHKAMAETRIAEVYPQATIVRLPLMFGALEASQHNFFGQTINRLRNVQNVTLFEDEYRSVCGARSIAEGLLQLVEVYKLPRIIHLAGLRSISRFEFGLLLAEAFRLNSSLLLPCKQEDIPSLSPRPKDVSMDITLAQNLGFRPMDVKQELLMIAAGNYI